MDLVLGAAGHQESCICGCATPVATEPGCAVGVEGRALLLSGRQKQPEHLAAGAQFSRSCSTFDPRNVKIDVNYAVRKVLDPTGSGPPLPHVLRVSASYEAIMLKPLSRLSSAVPALSLALSLAFGLSLAPAGAEPIRIGMGVDPSHSPFFVANQRGLFKKAGLDVNLVRFTQGGEA
eukprot:gene19344-23706_t